MAPVFRPYKTYINNRLYLPMIYTNGAFHYCTTYLMSAVKGGTSNFYTADNEILITADGKVFRAFVPKADAIADRSIVDITIVG